jgi:hypothetical protein
MALVAFEQHFPMAQCVIDDGLPARLLPPWSGDIRPLPARPRWMRDRIIGLSDKSNPGVWGGLLQEALHRREAHWLPKRD